MHSCLTPSKVKIDDRWDACIRIAQSAGFEAVDFHLDPEVPADHYGAVLHEHGIRFGSLTLDTPAWRSDASDVRDYLPRLRRQVDTLVDLGSSRASTWLLPYSDERKYRENFDWHIHRLKPIAELLSEKGCMLALEFVGPKSVRDNHKYAFIHTIEQTLELCEAIGDNVNLLLDSWHWHTSLGTIADLNSLLEGQVGLVHVNDAPYGVPIDQLRDTERCLPGATGVIDIGSFIAALRQLKYDGPIIAEPFDKTLGQLTAEEAARLTAESLRNIQSTQPHARLPESMRVIATGNRKVHLVNQPVPRPSGDQVVIKLHSILLCGSNMGQFYADREKINGGHEGAGEVVAVAHANRLRVGDRVGLAPINACGKCRYCLRGDVILCRNRPSFDGNFAEYTRVSEVMCVKLPDDISYDQGALLGCALGPPYGAIKTLGLRAFDTVVVTGLGPVGLGVCALATFLGARVLAVDPESYRRDIARELGADATLDSSDETFIDDLRDTLDKDGLRFGIDCSGNSEAERMHITLAAPNAKIAFIGENKGTIALSPSNDCIRKNLTLFGVWHMNVTDVEDLITFLRRCPDKAELLLSHRFCLSDAQEAFDAFASRRTAKVALHPTTEPALATAP